MVREIPTRSGKTILVDDEDYPRVAEFHWKAANTAERGKPEKWYAARQVNIDGKIWTIYLHRFLLGVPDGVTVDHIDGDGLNNQKANLRMASHRQQTWNRKHRTGASSPYKGVKKQKDSNRWTAWISHDGKSRYLGIFRTAKEAAHIFDAAARVLHGEFAWTNFPETNEEAVEYVRGILLEGKKTTRQRPRSLLTTAQVQQIRKDYANGIANQRELAERYGCHYSTICRIIRLNRYRDSVHDQVISNLGAD